VLVSVVCGYCPKISSMTWQHHPVTPSTSSLARQSFVLFPGPKKVLAECGTGLVWCLSRILFLVLFCFRATPVTSRKQDGHGPELWSEHEHRRSQAKPIPSHPPADQVRQDTGLRGLHGSTSPSLSFLPSFRSGNDADRLFILVIVIIIPSSELKN
jgi:hypothetical protein